MTQRSPVKLPSLNVGGEIDMNSDPGYAVIDLDDSGGTGFPQLNFFNQGTREWSFEFDVGGGMIRLRDQQNLVNAIEAHASGAIAFPIASGSGTSLPGTSNDGELVLFDDTDATDPSGRIQFRANGTTFTVNADAGHTYRDLPAYAEAHGHDDPQGPDETVCFECGDPFEVGDVVAQVVDRRRTASVDRIEPSEEEEDGGQPGGEFDEVHTVPVCGKCFVA